MKNTGALILAKGLNSNECITASTPAHNASSKFLPAACMANLAPLGPYNRNSDHSTDRTGLKYGAAY